MRTSFVASALLLWAGSVSAKKCSYGDNPQIIAHTGTPVGTEVAVNGCMYYHSSLLYCRPYHQAAQCSLVQHPGGPPPDDQERWDVSEKTAVLSNDDVNTC